MIGGSKEDFSVRGRYLDIYFGKNAPPRSRTLSPGSKTSKIIEDASKKGQVLKEFRSSTRATSSFSVSSSQHYSYMVKERLITPAVGQYHSKDTILQRKNKCMTNYNVQKNKPKKTEPPNPFCCSFTNNLCSYDIRKAVRDYFTAKNQNTDERWLRTHEKLSGFKFNKRISLSSISSVKVSDFQENVDAKDHHAKMIREKKFILKKVLQGQRVDAVEKELKFQKLNTSIEQKESEEKRGKSSQEKRSKANEIYLTLEPPKLKEEDSDGFSPTSSMGQNKTFKGFSGVSIEKISQNASDVHDPKQPSAFLVSGVLTSNRNHL